MIWTVLLAALAVGQAGAAAPAATGVEMAQQAWARALETKDVGALGDLYADDLTYVHGSGRVESKADFLARLASGERTYHRVASLEPRARVFGDTAVVSDLLDVEVEAGGTRQSVRVRSINVFVRQGGRWRIVHHQATRLP